LLKSSLCSCGFGGSLPFAGLFFNSELRIDASRPTQGLPISAADGRNAALLLAVIALTH
jgi:hypothetical protein